MTNGVYSAFVATTSADSAPAAHISSEKQIYCVTIAQQHTTAEKCVVVLRRQTYLQCMITDGHSNLNARKLPRLKLFRSLK